MHVRKGFCFLESSVICCVGWILVLAHSQNTGHGYITHNSIFLVASPTPAFIASHTAE